MVLYHKTICQSPDQGAEDRAAKTLDLDATDIVSAWIAFAAFRSVKENPDGKIFTEILEPVFDAGRDKQHIIFLECLSRCAADELSGAVGDHINFIARMRRLRISSARGIEFSDERAVLEKRDYAFFLRAGQSIDRVSQTYFETIFSSHGDAANNTLE